jgi:hypothetical protein
MATLDINESNRRREAVAKSATLEPAKAAYYVGIYIELTDDRVKEMRETMDSYNAEAATEVVLSYNGEKRECSLDELIAFMRGEK